MHPRSKCTQEFAGHLLPANWTNAPSGPTISVIVPATLPTKFYRLLKP
jgi:hypothetical protein